jgi:probable phosphoglycerate mutase
MASQIYLIRHGETEGSSAGRYIGRSDLLLTENGEHCAANLRGLLQGVMFSHVLTSPLQRAWRTCELAGFGAQARVERDLHELDYGDYEGWTPEEIHALNPGWNMFRDGSPHGESVEKYSRRAERVLANIRLLDGIVALFSHGQFLRMLTTLWLGLPIQNEEPVILGSASINILCYEHSDDACASASSWHVSSGAGSFLPSKEEEESFLMESLSFPPNQ